MYTSQRSGPQLSPFNNPKNVLYGLTRNICCSWTWTSFIWNMLPFWGYSISFYFCRSRKYAGTRRIHINYAFVTDHGKEERWQIINRSLTFSLNTQRRKFLLRRYGYTHRQWLLFGADATCFLSCFPYAALFSCGKRFILFLQGVFSSYVPR